MPSPDARKVSSQATPYVQKESDLHGTGLKPTIKSFENTEFLSSREGRLVRVICELEEPQHRLKRNGIRSTVLFFGSARSMTRAEYDNLTVSLEKDLEGTTDEARRKQVIGELVRLRKTEWMCEWVDRVEELARLVADFSQREKDLISSSFRYMPDYLHLGREGDEAEGAPETHKQYSDLVVTTGGGPGFMEAANRGAASVGDCKTMGMGITLPFEKGLNPFVSNDLVFEFHYFFTRKYWMMYSCRAIVVAPGGFGTLDETFELLTLRQTHKIPNLPVVLFDKTFWQTIVNWQAMADYGVISQAEVDSLYFADTPEEAMDFIKDFYVNLANK